MTDLLGLIEAAFTAPRPPDAELLAADCCDDGDIRAFYDIAHRRDVPDSLVVREYAALSFFSPAGLRHFLPAYLSWALRHPDSPQPAYDSTVWLLLPEYDRGRLDALTPAEVEAVIAFLGAVEHPDAGRALAYWRGRRA